MTRPRRRTTRLRLLPDPRRRTSVEVTRCPNGPLLVRGAESVRDTDGNRHEVTRPVVAVCACGKSQRGPWCDGTHKVIPNQ